MFFKYTRHRSHPIRESHKQRRRKEKKR
uniref:Uncharacterized protein n=1 Tax=Arundo donax TaxID=35708 RepID=A0A0A9HLU5_ARUDO